jgi:antibiotic biosynthesis monooxygenase (ABM) superfamily enzyme
MGKPVFYIVKSVVSPEHSAEFDEWYHQKHIPEIMARSGCKGARRFRAITPEDKFMYMAVYEFADMESFQKYQGSECKKALVADFVEHFGDKAELRSSSWEQIHP